MKFSRINSSIFSLLILALFSFVISSCSKENIENIESAPQVQDKTVPEQVNLFMTDFDENASVEEILQSLTKEEVIKYQNDYIAYEYIEELGLAEELLTDITTGRYSMDDAVNKLTNEQQVEIRSQYKDASDRGCVYISAGACIRYPWVCKKWGIPYPCTKRKCAFSVGIYFCW